MKVTMVLSIDEDRADVLVHAIEDILNALTGVEVEQTHPENLIAEAHQVRDRERIEDMEEAHAHGLHADLPREGCPECAVQFRGQR